MLEGHNSSTGVHTLKEIFPGKTFVTPSTDEDWVYEAFYMMTLAQVPINGQSKYTYVKPADELVAKVTVVVRELGMFIQLRI